VLTLDDEIGAMTDDRFTISGELHRPRHKPFVCGHMKNF